MVEESERLIALLNGQQSAHPPFWEPWFAMNRMLTEQYDGSYLKMAETLGHAAIPVGSVNTNTRFVERQDIASTGVWYGGGHLENIHQIRERPEPEFASQLPGILSKRDHAKQSGRACWITLPWCFHTIATSMSLEPFACACYDRPDFIHEAMNWVESRNQSAVREIIARTKPDFVLIDGDCAYKTGTMLSPQMMRDFTREPTRRTLDLITELGIPIAFHTDGKLDDVIPLLLELGVAAVHGCEKQANDLGHLVSEFGNDIVLCGNMDVVFLSGASPEEVSVTTVEMLEKGSSLGRFIAGCNTSPMDYIPPENYEAMANAIRDFAKS